MTENVTAALEEAARAYYEGTPIMEDAEYDASMLKAQADGIEVAELVAAGYVPTSNKVKHEMFMGTLDKATGEEPMRAWLSHLGDALVQVEPKWDGMAVLVTCKDGVLVQAATRGSGWIGEDVTTAVSHIQDLSIPTTPGTTYLQGEIVLDKAALLALNAEHDMEYTNTRNAAAGIIRRQDDLGAVLAGYLRFVNHESSANGWTRVPASDLDVVLAAIENLNATRASFPCEIDGAVVKVVDPELRNQLGYTSSSPRWAVAFKFDAAAAITQVTDVTWNVGRTGKLTPRMEFLPVTLVGASITACTLHNYQQFAAHQLRLGDSVLIERRGDVISYMAGVVSHVDAPLVEAPSVCPNCGETLYIDSQELRCPSNGACCLFEALVHALDSLEVDGVGPGTISALLDFNIIPQNDGLVAAMLALLDVKEEDISGLDGFGDRSAEMLVYQMNTVREVPLSWWMTSLGIPGVGYTLSQPIAARFPTTDALLAVTEDDLLGIDGMGPARAEALLSRIPMLTALRDGLAARNIFPHEEEAAAPQESKWSGMKIVVTGAISGWTRAQVESWLIDHGVQLQGSVSGTTDMLIAGERAGSKMARAIELGVTILPADEFIVEATQQDASEG